MNDKQRAYQREYQRKRRAKKKEEGICMVCSEPAISGKLRCAKHNRDMLESSKESRKTLSGKESRRKIEAANKQKKRRRGNGRFKSVKHFAKLKGKEWLLTESQYIELIQQNCYYCGLKNSSEAGVGLDRLDNNVGYIKSNVVSCCTECNVARGNNFTPDEMKIIGEAIQKIKLQRIETGQ